MSKITAQLLQKLAPSTPKSKRDRFLDDFNSVLPKYGITTELRVAAFLATVIMESDYLKALREYASGWDYDITRNSKKAKKLGNTQKGDGPKYKGGGGIETTGKNNYQRLTDTIGKRDGVDFVKNPELIEQPKYFVETACIFWKDNNLNSLADKGKFFAIQGIVNRGSATLKAKDYDKRLNIYDLALRLLPDDFKLGSVEESAEDGSKQHVKVEVGGGEVKVETSTTATQFPKIAVVTAKPRGFFGQLWAKVTGAIMGNGIFQWGLDQLEKIQALSIPDKVWLVLTILAILGTLIWLISEAVKGFQERKRRKEMEELLINQHSTAENRAQLIHPDDVEYFAAKGWKIINSGEKVENKDISSTSSESEQK